MVLDFPDLKGPSERDLKRLLEKIENNQVVHLTVADRGVLTRALDFMERADYAWVHISETDADSLATDDSKIAMLTQWRQKAARAGYEGALDGWCGKAVCAAQITTGVSNKSLLVVPYSRTTAPFLAFMKTGQVPVRVLVDHSDG